MRFKPGDRVLKLKGNCVGAYAVVTEDDGFSVKIRYEPGPLTGGRLRDSTYHSYISILDKPDELYID